MANKNTFWYYFSAQATFWYVLNLGLNFWLRGPAKATYPATASFP
jgi:hypothetical protein